MQTLACLKSVCVICVYSKIFPTDFFIGDFGSAKVMKPNIESTAYQVTRFYRPPELLLGIFACREKVGCLTTSAFFSFRRRLLHAARRRLERRLCARRNAARLRSFSGPRLEASIASFLSAALISKHFCFCEHCLFAENSSSKRLARRTQPSKPQCKRQRI